jgi:hypothetical protein
MQTFVSFSMKRITHLQNLLRMGLLFALFLPAIHAQTTQPCATGPLAPECGHPYLGAFADNYPHPPAPRPDWYGELQNHEGRIGRNVSIAHAYNSPLNRENPATNLTTEEQTVAGGTEHNDYLLVDWIISEDKKNWPEIAEGKFDATIESMAQSIAEVNNTVFLALEDEPQHEVTADPIGHCNGTYNSNGWGTTQDYVNMWHHVHDYFATHGVTNVVWVLIYQSDQSLNKDGVPGLFPCLMKSLYPGDNDVDWVAADIYDEGQGWHTEGVRPAKGKGIADLVYTEFTNDGFLNKPWMVSEWGSRSNYHEEGLFYTQVGEALRSEPQVFPNFQAYMIFDNYCSQIEYSNLPHMTCPPKGEPGMLNTAQQGVYVEQVADFINWQPTPPFNGTQPNRN